MGIEKQNRIFGLDLMRAVAILLVLFGHCIWIFPYDSGPMIQFMGFCGYFGVEVFFVLSGFLIGGILYKSFISENFGRASVKRFLIRRWFRTFPNYFLILLVNLLIASIIGYNVEAPWQYFLFVQNFAEPMMPFFPESWSLSIEEFAYIILPFTLLLLVGFRNSRSRVFAITTLALIGIFIVTKLIYHSANQNTSLESWNIGLKMVVIYRLDAILIGVLFSYIYFTSTNFWNKVKYLSAAIGMLLCGFFLFGVGKFQLTILDYPLFWNVMYLPLTSLSIALFLPLLSTWKEQGSYFGRMVSFISIISYSIYLLHYGIVLQLMKNFLVLGHASAEQSVGFVIIYVFLTLSFSWLLYRYYERPMTNLRERF